MNWNMDKIASTVVLGVAAMVGVVVLLGLMVLVFKEHGIWGIIGFIVMGFVVFCGMYLYDKNN